MNTANRLLIDQLATPVGLLHLVAEEDGVVRAIGWRDTPDRMGRQLEAYTKRGVSLVPAPDPGGATSVLRAYFAGELAAIDRLRVNAEGTEFQRSVWRVLREIPHGQTCSYGELARRIGNPSAVRAVGLANGANPIGIVVPCHRVIGADGSLTGYAGGIERKRWLLAHEKGGTRDQLELWAAR